MKNGKVHVQVIGIGGGGGNAVHHIAESNNKSAEFIAVNTDVQALDAVNVPLKLQIGEKLTNGFGSGADPVIGRKAAEEDYENICDTVAEADLVFLTAGLGGGTGTGAAPVIAKAAKDIGALTVAVVTLPLTFEGSKRAEIAKQGLIELKQIVDSVICIPNDRISKMTTEKTTLEQAFRMSDDILNNAIVAVSNLISQVGVINIDYNDIASVLSETGDVMVGFGEATGENHATKAVRYAMASPLLERNDIIGAKQVLLSFISGRDVCMKDINEAIGAVHNEIRNNTHIVFGVTTKEEMNSRTEITLIATGLPELKEPKKQNKKMTQIISATQEELDFLPAQKGLFTGYEPTLIDGVNYDTPTYVRWGRKCAA